MKKISVKYSPTKFQKLVHKACDSQEYKFIIVAASRRVGKSYLSKTQIIKWALEKPKQKVMVVHPIASQSKTYAREIFTALEKSGLVLKNTQSSGEMRILLSNHSTIEFKSAQSEDSLRGNEATHIVIDEAAYVKKEVFETIILPMVATNPDAKILLISTPWGRNWFYQYWLRGQEDNSNFISFRADYTAGKNIDESLINIFRETMNDKLFKQEFMAEWISDAAVFSNVEKVALLEPNILYKEKVYIGIDVALSNGGDNTVVTVLNKNREMIYQDTWNGLEVTQSVDRMVNIINSFNTVKALIEINSIGLPVSQLLKAKVGNKVGEFTTTSSSKDEIISNLVASFSTENIKIINDKDLIIELNSFIFKLGSTGNIRYEAMNGFHDDRVMSLAIALECVNNYSHEVTGLIGSPFKRR